MIIKSMKIYSEREKYFKDELVEVSTRDESSVEGSNAVLERRRRRRRGKSVIAAA